MDRPPFDEGAVQVSRTEAFPEVPDTAVGAPGTVAGVIEDEADEFGPVPAALMAATTKVYAVPLVRPVTLKLVLADPVSTGVCATPLMRGVIR